MWCTGAVVCRAGWLVCMVLGVAAGACFSPRYEPGIVCSETRTCPPGYACDLATNRCQDPEAPGNVGDAGSADAPSIPSFADADTLDEPRILVGGGSPDSPRQWSDGLYAASCQAYRYPQAPYQYEGAVGDGVYAIEPFPDVVAVVYCDMTTAGGGWTAIDPGAAFVLGGVASAAHSVGATTCRLQDGLFEAFYASLNGTDELVCRYDIPLGFAVDTVRVLSASDLGGQPAEHVLALAPVVGTGQVLDVSNLAALMWGVRSPTLLGDFGIGTPAHPGPALSLGAAFGQDTSVGSAANVTWPASASATTTSDTTLRLEYRENGSEDEGVRWVSGTVFVRHQASLPL